MLKINKSGLTLLEVLVAITIIAILAAGLYSVSNYLEKQAKEKLTESIIGVLCTALEQYRDFSSGSFPFTATADYNQTDLEGSSNGLDGAVIVGPAHLPDYCSSEALYYFLNQAPDSKKIIGSINSSLLTCKDENGADLEFTFAAGGPNYLLVRIIDPWKTAFRYTYNPGDNFPVITSDGPNKKLGDDDDISSK
jgi:prepilin-type N-terminal cleavage/methylation domain-containing protein